MTACRFAAHRGAVFASLLVALPVSACGAAGPAAISASNASRLRHDVQLIRSAAAAGSASQAHADVTALRDTVSRLVARGQLAATDGQILMTEAAQTNRLVSRQVQPVSSPANAQPVPATTQPAAGSTQVDPAAASSAPILTPGGGRGRGARQGYHGRGHGLGHGKGHRDGGDGGD